MSRIDGRNVRIVILGNSGSGKSTLARTLARRHGCPTLDLDTVFWDPDLPAVRRPLDDALRDAFTFCTINESWVVEGCYEQLIQPLLALEPELLFLDPGEERCLANCMARAWEPHKYPSKERQDEQLKPLLEWVRGYYSRSGEMSHVAHRSLYHSYAGPKRRLTRVTV